jgi:hypothetical protein
MKLTATNAADGTLKSACPYLSCLIGEFVGSFPLFLAVCAFLRIPFLLRVSRNKCARVSLPFFYLLRSIARPCFNALYVGDIRCALDAHFDRVVFLSLLVVTTVFYNWLNLCFPFSCFDHHTTFHPSTQTSLRHTTITTANAPTLLRGRNNWSKNRQDFR